MKRKLTFVLLGMGTLLLSSCSPVESKVQNAGPQIVVDPTVNVCRVFLLKDGRVEPVIREHERCLSAEDSIQQLLLGPQENEQGYTSDLQALVNEFPQVHYAFKDNEKTVMQLPIPLRHISDNGIQQISCTLSGTHDGSNLVLEGKDGAIKNLETCKNQAS
ncbi:MAG: hypothetical protein QM632_02950 [Micrococcaceae bacterium]